MRPDAKIPLAQRQLQRRQGYAEERLKVSVAHVDAGDSRRVGYRCSTEVAHNGVDGGVALPLEVRSRRAGRPRTRQAWNRVGEPSCDKTWSPSSPLSSALAE